MEWQQQSKIHQFERYCKWIVVVFLFPVDDANLLWAYAADLDQNTVISGVFQPLNRALQAEGTTEGVMQLQVTIRRCQMAVKAAL